ncbi:Ferroporti-1 [Naematelia encephala]|uniref:Solute carrier family 40 member n=1 Tax=Naematelia encephala TaxID=71784 RepID=A0A1Y2BFZ2_9TREE|nr:Ferroporti-1 [Naematelia encephala]
MSTRNVEDMDIVQLEPLLDPNDASRSSVEEGRESIKVEPLEVLPFICLLLQHASNTFNTGAHDFAIFLFLIEVFRDTLVPASLVGLAAKAAGLLLSGHVGGLVDRLPRLTFVRSMIAGEKGLEAVNYGLFLVLLGPLRNIAQSAFHGQATSLEVISTWTILLLTIAFSAMTSLAKTGMTVAIERDWITTIARGDPSHLTVLNTWMRRIDLLSKLLSPLFVSLLTTFTGYIWATTTLLVLSLATLVLEYWWIQVVYRGFPVLAHPEDDTADHDGSSVGQEDRTPIPKSIMDKAAAWARRERSDWAEFTRLPIFHSSVAIATIYLTTLSYDGTFISYIKAARGFDDAFIAIMRGVCVMTGMIGTVVMPFLEKRIGLERAGAWSIWFEVGCLSPVIFSFFYGIGIYGEHGSTWNSIILFGGIAASRIGLWAFDLCQLKELQLALDSHPRRNRLTALQISLQNLFDLLKYALTLAASTPRQFKWTAVVSWCAVVAGAISYAVYLRSVRGHLVHLEWFKKAC